MGAFSFSVGWALFLTGIPMLIVFNSRWSSSIKYEENSTPTNCTVLAVSVYEICNSDNPGTRWTYTSYVPMCNKKLIKTDDTCNSHPLSVNLTRHCYVHNSCDSFKWNHHVVMNRNQTICGLVFVIVGGLLVACWLNECLKDWKKKNQHRSSTKITVSTLPSNEPVDEEDVFFPDEEISTCDSDIESELLHTIQ